MVCTLTRSDLMTLAVYDRHATGEACSRFHPLILRASLLFRSNIHLAQFPSRTPRHGVKKKFSCDKLVTNLLFQQNDINPCVYKLFSDNLDLEQHGDDSLVCGSTSNLEVLAGEFKNHFLVKKAENVRLQPEHQNEIDFSNVASVLTISTGTLSWIKGMLKVWMRWR